VDSIFLPYARLDRPGYAVGIIQDGRVQLARGYGSANLDYQIPITSQSVFNVASLSKQFTAAAVAILIRRGKVKLEHRVKDHLPTFPDYPGPVRIEHLVYMTSGLPEYYTLPRPDGRDWEEDYFTVQDAIAATLGQHALLFHPGTRWAYSNVNYQILAEIVARVSRNSFASFVDREVFEPLHMTSSLVNDDLGTVIPKRVTGYNERRGGGYQQEVRRAPHYGGSGVFSSIDDLVRWDRSFDTHALGGPALTNLLLSTRRFEHAKANDAFGLVWGDFRGRRTLWYEGGDAGFSTYMVRLPDDHLTVIVLSNLGSGGAADHARRILELFVPRIPR
jgi:CubicO group peptidase (beta-lactamase class C family)